MNTVVVRTKLQAIIVNAMVEAGLIPGDVHLVLVAQDAADTSIRDIRHQAGRMSPPPRKTTVWLRGGVHMPFLFAHLLFCAWSARLRGHRLYAANVNWIALGLALKLCPGQAIFSFDDGSANVQQRDSSYLSESATRRRGPLGWLIRSVFPNGCASFVRGRIERHCTIYPHLPNIAPASRVDIVGIDWEQLMSDADRRALPPGIRRILLGTVYEAILEPAGPIAAADVEQTRRWADLYIPHPRDRSGRERAEVFMKYPAESIIGHYAKTGEIVVAHYNSSAALPFRELPGVHLVNLMVQPVSALQQAMAP